jgi:DNA-binding CsgD family transcriptional regulator
MGRSRQLRAGDERRIHRLLQDLVDLCADPGEHDQVLLAGLCNIVGANRGIAISIDNFRPVGALRLISGSSMGWDARELKLLNGFFTACDLREDTIIAAAARRPQSMIAVRREELVQDKEWKAAIPAAETRGLGNIRDLLGAYFRHREQNSMTGIALHRIGREREFNLRELEILRRFNRERYCLNVSAERDYKLTPRQSEIFRLFPAGLSRKAMADRLGVTIHTISEHIDNLYRKLQVHSDIEVMAKIYARGGRRRQRIDAEAHPLVGGYLQADRSK